MFLPGRDLNRKWWTIAEVRQYIHERGLDDRNMLGPLDEFDFAEEFLTLVIEYVNYQEIRQTLPPNE